MRCRTMRSAWKTVEGSAARSIVAPSESASNREAEAKDPAGSDAAEVGVELKPAGVGAKEEGGWAVLAAENGGTFVA